MEVVTISDAKARAAVEGHATFRDLKKRLRKRKIEFVLAKKPKEAADG